MPRAPHPKGGRPRTQPVLDALIQKSIDDAGGIYDPETGAYAEVVLTGLRSKDHAAEIIRSMYRSARFMKYSLPKPKTEPSPDGGYQIRYRVHDKELARKYVNAIPPERRAYNPDWRNEE